MFPLVSCPVQAFEWTVRNVRALRDYVEGTVLTLNTVSGDVPSIHEVLRDSPDMAEGKFKVEIGRPFLIFSARPSLFY